MSMEQPCFWSKIRQQVTSFFQELLSLHICDMLLVTQTDICQESKLHTAGHVYVYVDVDVDDVDDVDV